MELTSCKTSEKQHVELRASRKRTDFQHCMLFYSWLSDRNPFQIEDTNLHSLSTGVVSELGKDQVNCEQSEEIGRLIQASFDDMPYSACKIRRKQQVVNLLSLQNFRQRPQKSSACNVDSRIIFNRLILVAGRLERLDKAFEYELTREPMSLFSSGLMRKSEKASLRSFFLCQHLFPFTQTQSVQ